MEYAVCVPKEDKTPLKPRGRNDFGKSGNTQELEVYICGIEYVFLCLQNSQPRRDMSAIEAVAVVPARLIYQGRIREPGAALP